MSVDVKAEVTIYEKDDSDWGGSDEKLVVESHWNDEEFVVLVLDGHRYTVAARQLRAAVTAATVKP